MGNKRKTKRVSKRKTKRVAKPGANVLGVNVPGVNVPGVKNKPKKVTIPKIKDLCKIILKHKPNSKLIDMKSLHKYYELCLRYLRKLSNEKFELLQTNLGTREIDQKKEDILRNIFFSLNTKENMMMHQYINPSIKLKQVTPKQGLLHKCLSSYTFIQELGQGAFGKAYLVEKDKKQYTIKEITTRHMFMSKKKMIDKNKTEIETAIKMGEQNIGPKVYNYYKCKDKGELKMFLVMEYMTEGNLQQWIQTNTLRKKHQEQIMSKLKKMHSMMYYHSDVHLENIFVTKKNGNIEFYLGDFGQSYPGLDNIQKILSDNDNKQFKNSLQFNVNQKYNGIIVKLFILWGLI